MRWFPQWLLVAACITSACSAPERANPAQRCDEDTPCPAGLVCYREFCISEPGSVPPPSRSQPDADTEGPSEPASVEADAQADTRDATIGTRDASGSSDAEVDASLSRVDASAAAGDGSLPTAPQPPADAGMSGGPDDPASDAGTEEAGIPEPGNGGLDAATSQDIQRDLAVCLVLCNNNQTRCYTCFRRIIQEHPEVCDAENPTGADALVQRLCGILCTFPSCGGR